LAEAQQALGALAEAELSYRRAIEIDANHAESHNSLGVLCGMSGRREEALASFERAVLATPTWPTARFNLGLARKARGDLPGAVRSFFEGWRYDPASAECAGQCVSTLAEAIRGGLEAPVLPLPCAGAPLSFTIAFCSIDDAKCRRTIALYQRLFADVEHEIVAIRDARSLAEAYNRAAARSRRDVVVLSHDDIDILATDFAARLAECFDEMDVVGVIGGREVTGPRWSSAGHPHLAGWIAHHEAPQAPYAVDLVGPQRRMVGIKVLDGVFLAARRRVLEHVSFDEQIFDGFHLYDIDWTYRASAAGFVLGVAGDLLIVHESRGRFRQEWQRYADRFCEKHGIHYTPPAEPVKIWEAALDSADHVQRFFAHMTTLGDSPAPAAADQ
jgi:hypothetical protein